jgi:O-antigen/teichoic acid export membrane protein
MTASASPTEENTRGRGPDSIVKNAASSFVAQLTTASLTAILTLFLVRALGAEQYGVFALAVGIGSISIAFADFGISNSTARFVAEHRTQQHAVRALIADALKLKLVVTGLVCALIAALASVIAHIYGDARLVWPLRGIAIATFGQSLLMMLMLVSIALGRAVTNVRLVAIESLLEVSASVALVLAGAGAAGATFGRAFGYVLGAAIAAVVVLRMTGHGPVRFWSLPRRATIRKVGGYAGSVFAIDVTYTLSASLSLLFLGVYAGSAASGTFQAPMKFIVLIQYVGLSTANGVAPRLARAPGQEPDVRSLHGALRSLIGFQCLLLAPAVVWAGPITHVLLGSGYAGSAQVLAALAPYIFFVGLAPLVTNGVDYLGEARRRIPISLAALALTIVCGVTLVPRHGAVGAAIATDIAFGFYTVANLWLCRRLFKLRVGMLVWSLGSGLTAAAAMGIVLKSVGTTHLTGLDWLKGGAAGLATYVAMLVFTREIRDAHIARAAAATRAQLQRMRGAAPRRRRRERAMPTLPAAPRLRPRKTVKPALRAALDLRPRKTVKPALRAALDLRPRKTAKPALRAALDLRPRKTAKPALPAAPLLRPRKTAKPALPAVAAGSSWGGLRSALRRHLPRPPAVPRRVRRGSRSPASTPPGWVDGAVAESAAVLDASSPPASPAALPPAWLVQERDAQPLSRPGLREPVEANGTDAALANSRADATTEVPPAVEEEGADPALDVSNRERRLPPAAQPPPWLFDGGAGADAAGAAPAVAHEARRAREAFGDMRRTEEVAYRAGDLRTPEEVGNRRDALVFEIAWRFEEGVFELVPVEQSHGGAVVSGAAPGPESPPVPWRQRMPPAPIAEAREAHDTLVDTLLAVGWQRAGLGDTWFAHRFWHPEPRAENLTL